MEVFQRRGKFVLRLRKLRRLRREDQHPGYVFDATIKREYFCSANPDRTGSERSTKSPFWLLRPVHIEPINTVCQAYFLQVRNTYSFRILRALSSNIFCLSSAGISRALTLFNISRVQRSPFSGPNGWSVAKTTCSGP